MVINSAMISNILLDSCSITNSVANSYGGSIYLSSSFDGDVQILDGAFEELHAYIEGAFMYSESLTMNLELRRNNLKCFSVLDQVHIDTAQTTLSF